MGVKKVFLLEVSGPDGDVTLRRPSTSRHTILGAAHYVLESGSKDTWDLTIEISRVEMSEDEIAAAIKLFDETVHGEMAAAELAPAMKAAALEDEFAADHEEDPSED